MAERAVEEGKYHGGLVGGRGDAAARRDRRARRFEPPGERVLPAGECAHCRVGKEPSPIAVNADGGDAVSVRVSGPQDVSGRGARDVVLGRLATEEHDEMQACFHGANGTR